MVGFLLNCFKNCFCYCCLFVCVCVFLKIVMKGRGQRSVDVEELLRQSQGELLWIQRQLSIISARNARHTRAKDRVSL